MPIIIIQYFLLQISWQFDLC